MTREANVPGVAEADTIAVIVPIAVRKRGGRKAVTAPDGLRAVVPSDVRGDEALIKAVARAFRWRALIETVAHHTVAEIAAAEKVNPSYASRILRLTLLAPEIVEAILDRRHPAGITLAGLLRPFPVAWERQRSTLRETRLRSALRHKQKSKFEQPLPMAAGAG